MPSKSKAQHNLMALVANDPKAAKRLGIPQSVGRDYIEADKGRKFGSGGPMKHSKEMAKKEIAFMKKKGAPKSMIKHEKKEYGVAKMQAGGMPPVGGRSVSSRPVVKTLTPSGGMPPVGGRSVSSRPVVKRLTPSRAQAPFSAGFSKGGSVFRKAADGIAHKGKTKGMMVKMREGGKC